VSKTTTPRESGIINAKIGNGEVKVKKPRQTKEAQHSDVPKAVEKLEEAPAEVERIKVLKEKKEKPKKGKKKAEPKAVEFPVNGFINKYHFMRLNDAILEKLGWPTGEKVNVSLDVENGALVVKRRNAQVSLFFLFSFSFIRHRSLLLMMSVD
jgi:hypothetical protein